MKISKESPPNGIAEKAKGLWGIDLSRIVFTYGDTIYSKHELSDDLIAHESVHIKQQGNNPESWWERYFVDPVFRYQQELEAYREQYKWFVDHTKDRNALGRVLFMLASHLSGSMYGKVVSYREALIQIKK